MTIMKTKEDVLAFVESLDDTWDVDKRYRLTGDRSLAMIYVSCGGYGDRLTPSHKSTPPIPQVF